MEMHTTCSRATIRRAQRVLWTRVAAWQATRPSSSFAQTRQEMLSRPPKAIYDALTPLRSHLLNISLSDYLPATCHPSNFDPADPAALTLPPTDGGAAPPLPQGHHLVYFPPQMPPSHLLPDGTDPAHSPGGPYGRRMWAGGSVVFAPGWAEALRLDGRRAVCVEAVEAAALKGEEGSGAEKIFVDVVRRYGIVGSGGRQDADARAVEEAQRNPFVKEVRTLVFMRERPPPADQERVVPQAAASGKAPSRIVKAPYTPEFTIPLRPSAILLFHYSALTFNAHSIHLDPQYCREIEGHRGLLVHGPLSLTLMLAALRSQLGPGAGEHVRSIEYRNLAPLYAGEEMRVCLRKNPNPSSNGATRSEGGRKWDVWVEGPEGGLAVKAVAVTGLAT